VSADTIPARSNGQTINETWFNLIRSVLGVDLVPRNASGVATAVAGSLGSATYPWLKVFLGLAASGLSIEESSGSIIFKVGGVTKFRVSSSGIDRSYLAPLGQQVSSSCGNFSVSNTNYTDITNLSVGLTTTGRPVVLALVSDGSAGGSLLKVASTTTNNQISATMRFYETTTATELADGVIGKLHSGTAVLSMNSYTPAGTTSGVPLVGTPAVLTGIVGLNAPTLEASYPPNFEHKYIPAAGTYTYKVQVKTFAATTFTAKALKLIAFEL
jgi:hypothetical protein